MQKRDINSDSAPFKNIGTFWEPICDNNGYLMEPIFNLLPIEEGAPMEGVLAKRLIFVKVELPPTSNGMRRFLHGYLVRGTTDVVMHQCKAMTCTHLIRSLGTVRVPQQYVKKLIYYH
ncbi:uncharacterized protein LOC111065343 [Drosophila obscura]|uniref:uncharacterized protein LOC111065343 n=1 Tax=Drosophila obscura TaxID=7282 RepID=UPI000BA00D38|nr:uncharacterized protein LOC111065343 [Drosophila obscura]